MLSKTGVASFNDVQSVFPSKEKLNSFKAVIECYQEIPCNPCEMYCPFNAITIGDNINIRPTLVVDKCVGCSICVSVCPGVAIMLAKTNSSKSQFVIAYEFKPKPRVEEKWYAVNRAGEVIGEALIKKVVDTKKQDFSTLVTVECDASMLYEFSTIRRKAHE